MRGGWVSGRVPRQRRSSCWGVGCWAAMLSVGDESTKVGRVLLKGWDTKRGMGIELGFGI